MAACCEIEVGVSVTSPGLQVGKNTNIAFEININRHVNFTGLIWESIPFLNMFPSPIVYHKSITLLLCLCFLQDSSPLKIAI